MRVSASMKREINFVRTWVKVYFLIFSKWSAAGDVQKSGVIAEHIFKWNIILMEQLGDRCLLFLTVINLEFTLPTAKPLDKLCKLYHLYKLRQFYLSYTAALRIILGYRRSPILALCLSISMVCSKHGLNILAHRYMWLEWRQTEWDCSEK